MITAHETAERVHRAKIVQLEATETPKAAARILRLWATEREALAKATVNPVFAEMDMAVADLYRSEAARIGGQS